MTLELWNQVEATDPAFTKNFTKGGGFKGTAINPTYLTRRATETFGPIGIGWGVQIVGDAIVDGAPLKNGGCEKIHVVRIKLWYVWGDKRGEIEAFGQTTFVGSNKYGPFTDEDAPKKSLTDATTKALSLLGFSADVHLGMFDDNKYVNDRREAVASERKSSAQAKRDGDWDTLQDTFRSCKTIDQIEEALEAWKASRSDLKQSWIDSAEDMAEQFKAGLANITPHDPTTGEIQEPTISPADSAALKNNFIKQMRGCSSLDDLANYFREPEAKAAWKRLLPKDRKAIEAEKDKLKSQLAGKPSAVETMGAG